MTETSQKREGFASNYVVDKHLLIRMTAMVDAPSEAKQTLPGWGNSNNRPISRSYLPSNLDRPQVGGLRARNSDCHRLRSAFRLRIAATWTSLPGDTGDARLSARTLICFCLGKDERGRSSRGYAMGTCGFWLSSFTDFINELDRIVNCTRTIWHRIFFIYICDLVLQKRTR